MSDWTTVWRRQSKKEIVEEAIKSLSDDLNRIMGKSRSGRAGTPKEQKPDETQDGNT